MRLDARRIKITTQPTIEPVTATEAKLHLRIDHSTEDNLITRLIETARVQVEDISRRALITRTYTAKLDEWPADRSIEFAHPPLVSVTSVSYTDDDGATSTYSSSNYIVDTYSEPGRLVLKSGAQWPTAELQEINGVTVVYTAGYGATAADVPSRYKQAILLLVAHLYENRESVLVAQGVSVMQLPMGFYDLLLTDRGGWG